MSREPSIHSCKSETTENSATSLDLSQPAEDATLQTSNTQVRSPARLVPRSARNQRNALDDFAFLREAMEQGPDEAPEDATSVSSSNSAAHIPQVLHKKSEPKSLQPRQELSSRYNPDRMRKATSVDGIARPRSAQSGYSMASRTSEQSNARGPYATLDRDDTSDISIPSTNTHPPLNFSSSPRSTTAIPLPALDSIYMRETAKERNRNSLRIRKQEFKEWSQPCSLWTKEKSSSGGMLSKAPLIREVPAAMKRKIGGNKRDSSHLAPSEATLHCEEGKDGHWKRGTSVVRDDGYFRVFNDDGLVLLSIHLPSLKRTDIRIVDQSLFSKPHVIAIYKRSLTIPSTPSTTSFSKPSTSSSSSSTKEEPTYISFFSIVSMETLVVMVMCFAEPEFLLSSSSSSSDSRSHDPSNSSTEDDKVAPITQRTLLKPRMYRSITLAINEGRAVGEAGTEIARQTKSRTSEESSLEIGPDGLPIKSVKSYVTTTHRVDSHDFSHSQGFQTFCEIVLLGEVFARTSIRKNTVSPFWTESFHFSNLPSLDTPLLIRVYHWPRNSKPTLIGAACIHLDEYPRSEVVEEWVAIKLDFADMKAKETDTVGELNIGIRIDESVVLPGACYEPILDSLNEDTNANLATDLALEFPTDLEEISRLLLRIYQAEMKLIPRIFVLIEREIDGDMKSAAILFRGNTILTKIIELYLRLIGSEFLELALGETVRRICSTKTEIEIDPTKMKHGAKDKELASNVQELHDWSTCIWNCIYDAREKCPDEARLIFNQIQKVVTARYSEDVRRMRSTSVSAFVFLRFLVPAVLNPKLFNLVSHSPDPRSQRSLTLIAKTLQGLANFATFGQKEPWMSPMNRFVQDNTDAFVDFIDHISTVPSLMRNEWTSPHSVAYLAPTRLRNSLSVQNKEGIPGLPHLIDLSRDLGLLASYVARATTEKQNYRGAGNGKTSTAFSISSKAPSPLFENFADRCVKAHEEATRRGGKGRPRSSPPSGTPRARVVARSPKVRQNGWAPNPTDEDDSDSDSVELHIRNLTQGTIKPTSPSSVKRSNRSQTLTSAPARLNEYLTMPRAPQELIPRDELSAWRRGPRPRLSPMCPTSEAQGFAFPNQSSPSDDRRGGISAGMSRSRTMTGDTINILPVAIKRHSTGSAQSAGGTPTSYERFEFPDTSGNGMHRSSSVSTISAGSSSTEQAAVTIVQGALSGSTPSSSASNTPIIDSMNGFQHYISMGRRPSVPAVMGAFMLADDSKRSILARMGRKNSRA